MGFSDVVLLHGMDDTQLIVLRGLIDAVKSGPELIHDGCGKIEANIVSDCYGLSQRKLVTYDRLHVVNEGIFIGIFINVDPCDVPLPAEPCELALGKAA